MSDYNVLEDEIYHPLEHSRHHPSLWLAGYRRRGRRAGEQRRVGGVFIHLRIANSAEILRSRRDECSISTLVQVVLLPAVVLASWRGIQTGPSDLNGRPSDLARARRSSDPGGYLRYLTW